MRTPTALLAIALVTAALTACSPLQIALPQGAVEPDQGRYDYPPSELSAEEPLLCLDGERDGADCTEPGTLRWSVPLEGDHYVQDEGRSVVFDTRSRLESNSRSRGLVDDGVLYHFEDDFLRVHDIGTGEHHWAADLRGDVPSEVVDVERLGHRLFVMLNDGSAGALSSHELVVLDSRDGTETARLTDLAGPDTSHRPVLVGDVAEGDAVVLMPAPGLYTGVHVDTGAELWRAEVEQPSGTWALERQAYRIEGDALVVAQWSRPDDNSDWAVEEAYQFDGTTGEERGEPDIEEERPRDRDRPHQEFSVAPALDDDDRSDPRQFPAYDLDPDKREAMAGVGMGVLWPRDEEGERYDGLEIGVACAPDALQVEVPASLPDTLRCDNTRLFGINL